jgi:hypothetical protein
MKRALLLCAAIALPLMCSGCVVAPYDDGPAPAYGGGYYGYGPSYPWAVNTTVDIGGHGGYYHGGGYRGGYRGGGGGRVGGAFHGGGHR